MQYSTVQYRSVLRGDSEDDDDDDEDDWVIRSQARSVRRAKLDKRRFLRRHLQYTIYLLKYPS